MNLSGKHLNALEDRIVKRLKEREDLMVESYLSDGPPYGMEAVSGRELYDHLVALRDAGDPAYHNDPTAAVTLAKLEELYGPAPLLVPPFESPLVGRF